MIGKDEKDEENANSSQDWITLITEKGQYLKDTSIQAQDEIKLCFKRLVDVVKSREKQLLRQVDAIHRQQLSLVQSNLKLHSSIPSLIVNLSKENDLEKEVSQFGKIELSNNNCIINDAEPYKVEDYQEANQDHISFDKELRTDKTVNSPNSDSRNESYESKFIPTKSWNLNSTELINIQLIDEEFDESCVVNREVTLMELLACSLCSRENEYTLKDICGTGDENSVHVRNWENLCKTVEKKEFHKKHNLLTEDFEHPKQVQQWLQQILIETETEPNVPETEQFSEIPKSRVFSPCSLKT